VVDGGRVPVRNNRLSQTAFFCRVLLEALSITLFSTGWTTSARLEHIGSLHRTFGVHRQS